MFPLLQIPQGQWELNQSLVDHLSTSSNIESQASKYSYHAATFQSYARQRLFALCLLYSNNYCVRK